MDISFANKKLKDVCERQAKAVTTLGAEAARKLRARLCDLDAAEFVAELVAGRPHPLVGDRAGQFALDITGSMRLVFEPANDPIPRRVDQSIDWSSVTSVRIVFIGDYHG